VLFGNNPELLETLIENSDVCAIFCQKDATQRDIDRIQYVSGLNGIPVETPSKKELYAYIPYLRSLGAHIFLVCGYKYIIPQEIFEIPLMATINIHPSLLPRYRGQHVINWAIINGEKETGITFHHIDEGIDTGDIILQERIQIGPDETAFSLHSRIYTQASAMLKVLLSEVSVGKKLQSIKQNDSDATYFRPRKPEDGKIDWNKNGEAICNLARGLVRPWPGAYSYVGDNKIIFWSCDFQEAQIPGMNGQIIGKEGKKMLIKVHDGIISSDNYVIYDRSEDPDISELRPGYILK
jgi:methionyl-tRNA formyltransferase